MGKSWDHGVPGVEFWQAALRVAKPGAILMAFGGTRTFHRLACAIEDAGWEMRDTACWLYGSGFPKSLDISKQIDKRGGAQVAWFGPWFKQWREGRGIAQKEVAALFLSKSGGMTGCVANWELGLNMPTPEQFNLLCSTYDLPFGSIEEAEREVVGYQKRGNAVSTSFMSGGNDITVPATDASKLWSGYGTALKPAWEPIIVAMKPIEGTYAENAQKWGVAGLNIDGGRIEGQKPDCKNIPHASWRHMEGRTDIPESTPQVYDSAQGRWPANLLLDEESAALLGEASRFFYTAKASSSERNAGLEDCETKRDADRVRDDGVGGDNPRNRSNTPKQNFHPTVKPVDLMRYLCKLTKTPTGGVVLDPFMGSGTTGIACVLEHRDFIGIEIDEKYAEIAKKRIADMEGPLFQGGTDEVH